ELLCQSQFHLSRIDFEKFSDGADVNHISEQFAQARVRDDSFSKFGEWDRKKRQVTSQLIQPKLLFVNDDTLGIERHHIFARCLRVHCDQEINFFPSCDPTVFIRADREPGGQSRNIGWEQILPTDGDSHLKNGTHEYTVRRLTAGTVD